MLSKTLCPLRDFCLGARRGLEMHIPALCRTERSLPKALTTLRSPLQAPRNNSFLPLPRKQPAAGFLWPKPTQASFLAGNPGAARFWEKASGKALCWHSARSLPGLLGVICLVACPQESCPKAANPPPASTPLPRNARQRVGQEMLLPQQPAPRPTSHVPCRVATASAFPRELQRIR